MPQMSPLMWFSLFIKFSATLILFNQMNFFSFKPNLIKSAEKGTIEMKNLNWKWWQIYSQHLTHQLTSLIYH